MPGPSRSRKTSSQPTPISTGFLDPRNRPRSGRRGRSEDGNYPGKVRLVGFDYSDTIEQDLKDGVIDAVVVQDPFRIGFYGRPNDGFAP